MYYQMNKKIIIIIVKIKTINLFLNIIILPMKSITQSKKYDIPKV
jgi:hypothetical protein